MTLMASPGIDKRGGTRTFYSNLYTPQVVQPPSYMCQMVLSRANVGVLLFLLP